MLRPLSALRAYATAAFATVLVVPALVVAAPVPHTFANGTTADATQVNANFTALSTGLDQLPIRDLARGLDIRNDATTPNSKVRILADELNLQDASGNGLKARNVSVTADITTSGAGGLDTGSEANNTWYYLWVVGNGTTVAGLLSTSATTPTMPAGYAYRARVGAVRNESTGHFMTFVQLGSTVARQSTTVLTNGLNFPFAAVSLTAAVPPTARRCVGSMTVNSNVDSTRVGGNLAATASGLWNLTMVANVSATSYWSRPFELAIVEPQTIYYQNGWSAPIALDITGWEYER